MTRRVPAELSGLVILNRETLRASEEAGSCATCLGNSAWGNEWLGDMSGGISNCGI